MMDHPAWPEGRQEGREALQNALLAGLAALREGQAHTWWWCSPDWADWPLEHPDLLAGLQAWMLAGGHLKLLAADYRHITAQHPRFVQWRVQWTHRIEARGVGRSGRDSCPNLCWSPLGGWEVLAAERGVLVSSATPRAVVAWQERFQGLWERATPAFPGTTLGL
jgi:hypothetical protein